MTAADQLLAALDAASTESARAALLAGASPELLEKVQATIVYRGFVSAPDPFATFTAELAVQPDDAARLKVIEAARADPQRGPAFIAEWHFWRTASTADALRRYLAMLDGPELSDTYCEGKQI